ncbi:MAG: potassium transporter TrkG, partial [Thermococcus sp.]
MLFSGMTPFDAVNYAMTGVGTGGMAPHDASMGYYGSMPQWTMILFMVLGATNFVALYYAIFRRTPKALIRDKQFQMMIAIIVLTTLL